VAGVRLIPLFRLSKGRLTHWILLSAAWFLFSALAITTFVPVIIIDRS
jgi:hypothetical protein